MTYNEIEDFNISGEVIPSDIEVKIIKHHLEPLEQVSNCLGYRVYPSVKSCYRSKKWELKRGRSGKSQHCFIGLGACDVTCEDFENNKDELLESLIKQTTYIRFAVYKTFIHCDYKDTHKGKRLLFNSTSSSKWTFKKFI